MIIDPIVYYCIIIPMSELQKIEIRGIEAMAPSPWCAQCSLLERIVMDGVPKMKSGSDHATKIHVRACKCYRLPDRYENDHPKAGQLRINPVVVLAVLEGESEVTRKGELPAGDERRTRLVRQGFSTRGDVCLSGEGLSVAPNLVSFVAEDFFSGPMIYSKRLDDI